MQKDSKEIQNDFTDKPAKRCKATTDRKQPWT